MSNDERAAFEAHAQNHGWDTTTRADGRWNDLTIWGAWIGWKHRAAIAQQPAPKADTRKLCTCDGAGRGPGRACVVKAGGRLGELWRCAEGNEGAAIAQPAEPAYVDCGECPRISTGCPAGGCLKKPAAQADAQPAARIDPMQDPMRPGCFMNYATDETPAEMVLRKLACWLGVGGYNAPTVDAELFHRKIVDGVQMLAAAPPARQPLSDERDPVVGHKTFRDGPLGFRYEPLRSSEAAVIMAAVEAADKRRAELMPDEKAAIRLMFEARQRLIELGWNDAIYCPKDGSEFDAIEAGSTGIHRCHYSGEWPNGSWWVADDGDLYPSRPVLYRKSSPGGIGREGE